MSFSLIGNIVISVIAGTVVGVAAVIVGAPSPMVLALIVGLLDLIPQIGSTIAAFIVTLVTLIASGPGRRPRSCSSVILVYQQAENYLIQPAVMRQAVELSGFATIAVVMVGGALLGVVGAVLAVPVAASVKIVLHELTEGRRARMAALSGADEPGRREDQRASRVRRRAPCMNLAGPGVGYPRILAFCGCELLVGEDALLVERSRAA